MIASRNTGVSKLYMEREPIARGLLNGRLHALFRQRSRAIRIILWSNEPELLLPGLFTLCPRAQPDVAEPE